jgi:hypothetical protein
MLKLEAALRETAIILDGRFSKHATWVCQLCGQWATEDMGKAGAIIHESTCALG